MTDLQRRTGVFQLGLADAELTVQVDPQNVPQAPATIYLTVQGGMPLIPMAVQFNGQVIASALLDAEGSVTRMPINITAAMGSVGSHTLTLEQTSTNGVNTHGEASYNVLQASEILPVAATADALPVAVPEAEQPTGRRWVFQDLSVGGLGSWVLPINPREMTSPHLEHMFTSRHTTSHEGRFHIFQAAMVPKEWQFGGYCPTEEMAETLWQWRELNRRIYIVDHHGRAWKTIITNLEIVPRLQHIYNGAISDWGSDWTMTATVLDQEPTLI